MTDPWEGQENQELAAAIKKVRRRTLIRNILISLAVSLITLVVIFIGAAHLIDHESSETMFDEYGYMSISSPNEYLEPGHKDRRGFLSGVLELDTYKIVEGIPIPWREKWINYHVTGFPFTTGVHGGTTSLEGDDPALKAQGYEYNRRYNPDNGQREMLFYVPGADYNGKILNDIPSLSQMESGKLVEMALSFDKNYSFAEVKAMLPAGVRPVWYWVDTYDDWKDFGLEPEKNGDGVIVYPQPLISTYGVYGFGVRPHSENPDPADFIGSVKVGLQQKGKYYSEYKRIYTYLKKDKPEPGTSDVRILGVVVTGTTRGLQSLNGQPYIRGAVLGAVADRY
ncbi:anti-sigma factor [Paenibacillus sabinae]|uniref:DedA integral membrane protein n=1 Tax=Paenibacillus sabinae T27 TaxID=1268072 RepID=X4ZFL2_9BACL|nr:anti-sigma factor [Paenibacillus sabinae]AHV96227.1 DedA integral membrane protein [Paenibacillus sabinae T27]